MKLPGAKIMEKLIEAYNAYNVMALKFEHLKEEVEKSEKNTQLVLEKLLNENADLKNRITLLELRFSTTVEKAVYDCLKTNDGADHIKNLLTK